MKRELFDRRVLLWAIPIAAGSLIASLLATVLGAELFEPVGVAPSRYSRSAIGHRAFFDLLHALEVEVETSRANSGHKVRDGSLLIVAEPQPAAWNPENGYRSEFAFARELPVGAHSLVVLPKWEAEAHPRNGKFALSVELRRITEVSEVLDAIAEFGDHRWEVVRPSTATVHWKVEVPGTTPDLPSPQLMRHPRLESWLGSDEGTLIGMYRSEGREIVIVSDPDLISNHGLVRSDGSNAVIAIELIDRLLAGPRRVVVDEACHGAGVEGGFWREAMRFPLVIVLVHSTVLCGMVLWGALGRFGPPEEEVIGLEAGSRLLIRSTAELLTFGGHRGEALGQFLRIAVDGACRRLRGPATGSLRERVAWLAERGRRKEISVDIERLAYQVHALPRGSPEEKVRGLALAIDRWRWEIVHGSEGDRRGR